MAIWGAKYFSETECKVSIKDSLRMGYTKAGLQFIESKYQMFFPWENISITVKIFTSFEHLHDTAPTI